jgi:hypothetical protein
MMIRGVRQVETRNTAPRSPVVVDMQTSLLLRGSHRDRPGAEELMHLHENANPRLRKSIALQRCKSVQSGPMN